MARCFTLLPNPYVMSLRSLNPTEIEPLQSFSPVNLFVCIFSSFLPQVAPAAVLSA